jgi:cytochrome c peroxidase/DNA-binding beta-propeller fold protein YncE
MRTWMTATLFVFALGAVEHGRVASGARTLMAYVKPARAHPEQPGVTPLGDPHTGSQVVLARVGEHDIAYVADEDDALIHIVDTAGPTEIGTAALPGRPGQLLVLPDGRLVAAVRGGAEIVTFRIAAANIARLEPEAAIATALEPVGLATTPDDKRLLVTSGWGRSLSILDVATGRESTRLRLPRDPRSVVTSADGTKAFVSHAVGSQLSVIDLADPGHSVVASSVDGWSNENARNFGFPMMMRESFREASTQAEVDVPQTVHHARMACQGFALARVDQPQERVLLPQVQVETGDTTVRSGGYGGGAGLATEMPNVAVVPVATGIADPRSMEVFATTRTYGDHFDPGVPETRDVRGETVLTPCVLPRAATAGNGSLYVACLGIDSVVEYDADVAAPQRVEHRRWPVPSGPQGIALVGSHLYVWSQFARTLTVLDVEPKVEKTTPDVAEDNKAAEDTVSLRVQAAEAPRVGLSRKPTFASNADVELGRMLFHASSDARIAFDGRSCASCHPDGRDDSLTWSTPTGPRQTPMLAGRLEETAPYGWDGEGPNVPVHLEHTFQRLSGRGLRSHEMAALVAYIKSLPVPPRIAAKKDDEAVAEGAAIFHSEEAGCSSCHSVDGALTDGMSHDIGTKAEADAKPDFDTPSLRFVSGTAPYFHDGRYATLRDVLTHTDGAMGHTGHLSSEDLDALEAYVETL